MSNRLITPGEGADGWWETPGRGRRLVWGVAGGEAGAHLGGHAAGAAAGQDPRGSGLWGGAQPRGSCTIRQPGLSHKVCEDALEGGVWWSLGLTGPESI